jgi:hypothetical protein
MERIAGSYVFQVAVNGVSNSAFALTGMKPKVSNRLKSGSTLAR